MRPYALGNTSFSQKHTAPVTKVARAAIRLYRLILVENPKNLEVALRVAPILAYAGERF